MKRIPVTTLCIGTVLGLSLAIAMIWFWQIAKGNISFISIFATIIVAVCFFVCCQIQKRIALKKAEKAHYEKLRKYQSYYYLLHSWMVLRNKGRRLADYFEDHNFKNIAICGLGRLGLNLYEELKGSGINVKYGIDNKSESFSYLDLKVIFPESDFEKVDAIVVTKFAEYDKIVEELRKKTSCQVVSLQDVIFSM